ncbi:hypothetical protein [Sphingomonas sp. R86521]|uniref:phage integrase central domain-containing protein n=1 Tax=Sphingomonas sp. R86521 TaxID=3093860 RepID=UPI0036D23079
MAHATDAPASLERDVFSAIGTIATPVVLTALCMIEARGRLETAKRVRQRISGAFMFAIDDAPVQQDPAGMLGRV